VFLGLTDDNDLTFDLRDLQRIVPGQKIAPIQFDIKEGRLFIIKQRNRTAQEDESNAKAAREALIAQGEELLAKMKESNCDRRFIESFERLQGELAVEENIIKVGISNLVCVEMCTAFENEVSLALAGMLRGHTRAIDLLCAQYPDWNRFVENAASSQLNDEDVEILVETTGVVVEKLRDTQLAEPDVPVTISYLRELLRKPGTSGRRAAFAVMRTLENMISKVFEYATAMVDESVKETIKQTSKAIGRIVAGGLLLLAIESAGSLSTVAQKIPESRWITQASEIIKKHIEEMKAGR
jgi:hypothetical protein